MENEKEFVVVITETLQRKVIIKASNKQDAFNKALTDYEQQEIVLDYNDFLETDIQVQEK